MNTIKLASAAHEFLAQKRIAVAGVSATTPNAANGIYRRLREKGYAVFALNPNADIVEGDRCYHSLRDIETKVDGVVIGTHPKAALDVANDCIALHVPRVWFHKTFGAGSYSQDAVHACEEAGLNVIAGACPLMFIDGADAGHRCFKWIFTAAGKLPRECHYDAHHE